MPARQWIELDFFILSFVFLYMICLINAKQKKKRIYGSILFFLFRCPHPSVIYFQKNRIHWRTSLKYFTSLGLVIVFNSSFRPQTISWNIFFRLLCNHFGLETVDDGLRLLRIVSCYDSNFYILIISWKMTSIKLYSNLVCAYYL